MPPSPGLHDSPNAAFGATNSYNYIAANRPIKIQVKVHCDNNTSWGSDRLDIFLATDVDAANPGAIQWKHIGDPLRCPGPGWQLLEVVTKMPNVGQDGIALVRAVFT